VLLSKNFAYVLEGHWSTLALMIEVTLALM